MPQPPRTSLPPLAPLLFIAVIVGASAGAFAYTAGWLSPQRLTPDRMVDALTPPTGEPLGHRRNHAKGVCFTGTFQANGAGTALSTAPMLASGQYPVLGRFNLGTADPNAPDATVRIRGLGLQIRAPDGQVWRAAMIDSPVFPVSTVDAFYDLLRASSSKDPEAMKAFAAAHPEIGAFGAWAGSAPFQGSYASVRFNSLNSFLFTDASGAAHAVRWSLLPAAQPTPLTQEQLAGRGADDLEREITQRVATGPQRWTLVVTVANPGDPTADPAKAWPEDRRAVDVGTLVVDKVQPEPDGPCRDINFDPTVLPSGMAVSDDPFPAARSAAYAKSFDRRTAEAAHYPRTVGARP